MIYKFTLPLPPSVNKMFKSFLMGKKIIRAKSQEYREWCTEAKNGFTAPRIALKPDYEVFYKIFFPAKPKRRRDLSNYVKGLDDFLVDNGVIEDDSFIRKMTLELGGFDGDGRVEGEIREAETL